MSRDASTWLNNPEANINKELIHKEHTTHAKVFKNIVEAVGNTPLVRLSHIPQSYGLKCEVFVKCEFMNPGGSVKDRIGVRMVEDAEKLGLIKPGDTIIEATSGNTGIGICMAAAVKGYKMIITLPEKMSQEKVNVMKGLGAEIIRTPSDISWNHYDSHIELAKRIRDSLPNAVILDQYSNSSNPLAHYNHTGQEIVDQCEGKLDYFFACTGTGGTMTGCATKIKEKISTCKCIGVDPHGSIMAQPDSLNTIQESYHVEGIGYDFIPSVCVRSHIDEWVKINDKESFDMARRLIREEGLLCGGSSGSAVAGAIKYALEHNLNENHRIVIMLPDSVRNYINRFLSDDWMVDKGFISNQLYLDTDSKVYGKKVSELKLVPVIPADKTLTVNQALDIFEQGAEVIPVVENNKVKSVLYPNKLMAGIQTKKLTGDDAIQRCTNKDFVVVEMDTDLSIVQKFLDRHPVVIVEEQNKSASIPNFYVATTKNLLKYYR